MKKISRRSFARNAIVAAAAVAVAPSVMTQTQPAAPKTTPAAPKPPDNPAAPPAASQAEVDARVQWIVTKYGAHLDDAQRADIRRIVSAAQSGIDAMRQFDLGNATGPAEPFRIYRRTARR